MLGRSIDTNFLIFTVTKLPHCTIDVECINVEFNGIPINCYFELTYNSYLCLPAILTLMKTKILI